MARIKYTVVASGVIGQYDHEWTIKRLYDDNYGAECYNLYIGKEYIDCFSSVVKALATLIEQFDE